MVESKKKQLRYNVTFRDNATEKELYEWIGKKGELGSVSNFIKTELYKIMQIEKENNN